ncbi:heat shock 70 kDa protein 12A-like [Pecten maximus]|uniref:heat shock 70 kDa protein 12A-like n=1 Tax=Pecten maximus TaxID=6579 RepID=UPI00145889BC|nr:heat shock 70 kDa protein 12A-like [Pecten maximus]
MDIPISSLAIHIGETHSSYALAFFHDLEKSELYGASCKRWPYSKFRLETSTALLLKPNKSFDSFGGEADRHYADMAEEGEDQSNYYYVRNLHHVEKFNKNTKLKDETGKMINVFDIFVHIIRFLVGDFAKTVKDLIPDKRIYVICIPARWGYSAKQLVREAAEMAGIPRDELKVVFEPVVAKFGFHKDKDIDKKSFYEAAKSGAEYVILDLGVRAADISCHQHGGFIRHLLPSKGSALGGDTVTEEYVKFLGKIFGEKYLVRLKEEYTEEYLDILHGFLARTRHISGEMNKFIGLHTQLLLTCFGRKKDDVDLSRFDGSVHINTSYRLRISMAQCQRLFEKYITAIERSIERIIQDERFEDFEYLLMIGEFSEFELVTRAIRKTFPQKKIIVSRDAGLSVLKGAVYFGFLSETNTQGVQYTYGIQHWPEFNKSKHPLDRLVVIDGVTRCKDVFSKFIEKGQTIPENQRVSCVWTPFSNSSYHTIDCTVYISSQTDPMFTDDDGCAVLGVLHTPFTVDMKKEALKIEQTLIFGRTCITLQAKNMATGQICETQIEYM